MAQIDTRPGCKDPRCKNRAVKRGFCLDHQIEASKSLKEYDAKKNPEKVKVYNSQKWKNTRSEILRKRPLCTRCYALGNIKSAQMVDHLVGFRNENDPHAWDPSFLFPLCNICHGIVTGKEKHTNFLAMPLLEAVYLKYDGFIPDITDDTIYI